MKTNTKFKSSVFSLLFSEPYKRKERSEKRKKFLFAGFSYSLMSAARMLEIRFLSDNNSFLFSLFSFLLHNVHRPCVRKDNRRQ